MKKKLLGVAKLEDISTIDGRGYVYWVYIQILYRVYNNKNNNNNTFISPVSPQTKLLLF